MAAKITQTTLNGIARSIDTMQSQITILRSQMVTKDDLENTVAGLATKDDLEDAIAGLVTKDDFDKTIAGLVTKEDFDQSIAGLITKGDFDRSIASLVTTDDFDRSISRLEATIRREAGDLGESIASLTNMVAREFDNLTITRPHGQS